MVSKPPLSHPLSLLLPLASIRRSVNTGRGPQTPRCVMVSTPRGLLLATLLVLHQPLRTLSREQPYQSWLVLFETSSYFNADYKKCQIQQLHITMLVKSSLFRLHFCAYSSGNRTGSVSKQERIFLHICHFRSFSVNLSYLSWSIPFSLDCNIKRLYFWI